MNDLHSFNNDNKSIINVIVCSKSTSEESEPAIGKGTKKVTKNYGQLKQLTEIESKPIKQQIRSKISSVKNMNQSHKSLIEQHINSNTIENSRKGNEFILIYQHYKFLLNPLIFLIIVYFYLNFLQSIKTKLKITTNLIK